MTSLASAAIGLVTLGQAAAQPSPPGFDAAGLDADIAAGFQALDVPGGAVAVIEGGRIVHERAFGVTREGEAFQQDTVLRFASVSKAVTALALVQLEADGRLSLEDPLSSWDGEWTGPDSVTLAHLAGHVSEGIPGETYVYGTNRYARLGPVIEAASGRSLADYFCTHIQSPAGAQCHDSPFLGAHAGLRMSVADMARIVAAMQAGGVLDTAGLDRAFTPFTLNDGRAGPAAVGWFVHEIGGEPVIWSFGQDDPDHSGALVAFLPERDLGFVMLANANAVSDPYRLLGGDALASPFLLAFLDAAAPDLGRRIDPAYRVLSDGLTAAFRMDLPTAQAAFTQVSQAFDQAPPPALVFFASLLSGPGYGDAADADRALAIVEMAAAQDPGDRWARLFAAGTQSAVGSIERARAHYEAILALDNQEPDFLNALIRAWANRGLAQSYLSEDPARALTYVEAGLSTGVSGESRDQLLAMQASLQGAN